MDYRDVIKSVTRAAIFYFSGLKNGTIKPPPVDLRIELTPEEIKKR
jgi:hypothetical protein